MKRVVTLLAIFGFIYQAHAAHIIGGELTYRCLGGNDYEVTLKLYRDCNGNGADFDNVAYVAAYKPGDATPTVNAAIPFPGSQIIPVEVDNPCLETPPNICIEEAVYMDTLTLPTNPWGYDLVYQRCCRIGSIVNIMTPGDVGATYWTHISGFAEGAPCNNSPVFTNAPPAVLCIGDSLSFDHSATDVDGDSLVYSLYRPLTGGGTQMNAGCNGIVPNPPCEGPFTPISWQNGYNDDYQMDANPALAIDPETGILSGSPTQAGIYLVGIRVQEYRNGIMLSEVLKDFQFNVVVCQPQITTAIADQQFFCSGLTVVFINNSANGETFFWDFGDTTTTMDTSSQVSPTYTYSDTGTYTITLIANPGWPCADTATSEFGVFPALFPAYAPPEPQCLNNNSFDFEAGGFFAGTGTFMWDFGANATPDQSTDQDPTGIQFSQVGYHVVELTIDENDCVDTYTDSILVLSSPTVDFTAAGDVEGCAPLEVQFTNQSAPLDELESNWDFAGLGTSDEENPSFVFDVPGSYSIDLSVTNDDGCSEDITQTDLITVHPNPTAGFSVNPEEVMLTSPQINVLGESPDDVNCDYLIGANSISADCDFDYNFSSAGTFIITQIVSNEFGCMDTTLKTVVVVDDRDTLLVIPNTITPNNDGANDTWQVDKIDIYPKNTVKIFTRNGQLIYEAGPYRNEEGWDGLFEGNELPGGVYFYLIDLQNGQEPVTGTINLIKGAQ